MAGGDLQMSPHSSEAFSGEMRAFKKCSFMAV